MVLDESLLALPGNILTNPPNAGSAQCLGGSSPLLCAPEVLSAWVAFLALAIWFGGLFWQTVIIERAAQRDSALIPTAQATGARFYRVAVVALVAFLVANISYFMGLLMLEGESWSSGFSPTLWGDALRSGSFGVFWLLRELLALLTLLLLVLFPQPPATQDDWRPRQKLTWAEMALAALLLAAVALSEQMPAAQAKGTPGALAVPLDWLFLLAMSLWVGGLLSIALILFPAIWGYEAAERGRIVAALLPRFSATALVSAVVAALSAAFNAYSQLTSWNQFAGTPYGRTLIVGMLLFILMVSISAYRASWLRPALARELDSWDQLQAAAVPLAAGAVQQASVALPALTQAADGQDIQSGSDSDTILTSAAEKQGASQDTRMPEREGAESQALRRIDALHVRFHSWIQYETMLGGVVLLCVALLGVLVGSLAPATGNNGPTLTATTKTPVDITQTADHLRVTLKVTPDTFGTNTFGVLVVDATTGQPVDSASIHLTMNMLEMDMGTVTSDLKGVGKGFYVGKGDLVMNGHWQVQVQVLVPQDPTIHQFTFEFSVSFS
jgi:putative copper export protein